MLDYMLGQKIYACDLMKNIMSVSFNVLYIILVLSRHCIIEHAQVTYNSPLNWFDLIKKSGPAMHTAFESGTAFAGSAGPSMLPLYLIRINTLALLPTDTLSRTRAKGQELKKSLLQEASIVTMVEFIICYTCRIKTMSF